MAILQIRVIVNRILSFPIASPVSRFLTGLELLRDKIEEWNKNAHKGNNMIELSLAVGQQIINWRKLEMGHWKECFNNLYQRSVTCEGRVRWKESETGRMQALLFIVTICKYTLQMQNQRIVAVCALNGRDDSA